MTTIFIDGSSGTTGLQIRERLSKRTDLSILEVPYELRHEEAVRREALNKADIAFLCLPDDAAEVSAQLCEDPSTVIIDTSTRHRTEPGWVYGLAELEGQREQIRTAKRIANPGCHATGFITLVAPLVKTGLLKPDVSLQCFSLTGYSGGGKKMIAEYEADPRAPLLDAPRMYGLSQNHKHLEEMKVISGLTAEPIFCPIVADYYSGMETVVPLFAHDITGTAEDIRNVYRAQYQGPMITFAEAAAEGNFRSGNAFAGRDDLEVRVEGNDERILLVSRFDNLGKGACGAAIQNLNIVLGIDETTGLKTGGSL